MTIARYQELVQYYVVNKELPMSAGKIAAQVAHAATTLTLHVLLNEQANHQLFQAWLEAGQKKVVLKASQEELVSLAEKGFLGIRDAGHTEIPSGSLTVVVLPPMEKTEAQQFVGRLPLL